MKSSMLITTLSLLIDLVVHISCKTNNHIDLPLIRSVDVVIC